ncbi:MAG: MobF family relaxase [Nocardioides sp.]
MSLHKLTAGSGYTYLTRQVAALDATDKGGVGLASYYTARGETPGAWIGSGVAGIAGLAAGDVVTPSQMQSLFGSGHHPLADERKAELEKVRTQRAQDRVQERVRAQREARAAGGRGAGRTRLAEPITEAERREARRLGTPYKVYDNDVSPFRIEVAKRMESFNEVAGLPRDWPVPASERARIRTEVATSFFRAEHGRDPADARELAATIAKHSRPKTTAVAGYDLTFSPVKSVSTLWAIAEPAVAAKIELAHQAAIKDALTFIEKHALFTRTGSNGVRQVDVTGLVATAFTHRDSRAGDPDLHTHVAVSNKVQTHDGRWLAIDGRVLYKAAVAASETYNTALEKHLGDSLGLRFEPRVDRPTVAVSQAGRAPERGQPITQPATQSGTDVRKRPIREVIGVDAALNIRWSARRASIEVRRSELAAQFQATHGRPPSPVEALQLAQQATLETRDAKHEPRSLTEQRTSWRAQAIEMFGGGRRGEQRFATMIQTTLSPTPKGGAEAVRAGGGETPGSKWFADAADRTVTAMEERRSTWQVWHVRAEAQRQVRSADLSELTGEQVDRLVDLLVDDVIGTRSVSLARPHDLPEGVLEPAKLRRLDGASVYTVAGADMHTSAVVLAAEQRIVAAAGLTGGHQVEDRCVDLALLESAANGVTLNAGQAALVRQMATSGSRVQMAIAPAGSGKTTAMNALTGAWTEGGGTVVGLAPSAAAAAQLRDSITTPGTTPGTGTRAGGSDRSGARVHTETLAKLTHSIRTGHLPGWVEGIGPDTLVVIDEAGMADTLSLDQAINFVLERGGSVRLIGDDQQLAAIGAGGVLRDIIASHGALQLSELMRFSDPAEGAASLALREGDASAIGFYLDKSRVHVGDLSTMTDEVFGAWQADRANGLDSIMLAPTRDLVSELNQRARADRLTGLTDPAAGPDGTPDAGAESLPDSLLSDGNRASVGELVITRSNDRRLRTSASDWVKNGDRWTVLKVHSQDASRAASGPADLTVQHSQTGRIVRLPAEYVAASVELGYATTIHTAQGVSADSMHGLASDELSRQLLYTMLTRGRLANHLYLPIVGDGDPHSVIRPEMILPQTATDLIERMLARDETPASASSLLREQNDPAARLGDAAARYLDSLYVAAEDVADSEFVGRLDRAAEEVSPGLSEEAAWPALRAHLLLLAAAGEDPLAQLRAAADEDELDSARDVAAVLDWRLDDTGLRSTGSAGAGPLPWMPAVPGSLRAHPEWGEYLDARSELVVDLAERVHTRALGHEPAVDPAVDPEPGPAGAAPATPVWARNGLLPDAEVIADVEVWRAAMLVDRADRRPTGRPALQKAQARYQRSLNRRITGDRTPAMQEWGHVLATVLPASPRISADDFAPQLADRLAAISRAGIDAGRLVRQAANTGGALPDDHAAAALWWRISGRLSPAVAAQLDQEDGDHSLTTSWAPRLVDLVGIERADRIQASPWWPTLVTVVDHAMQRGWQLDTLLTAGRTDIAGSGGMDGPDGPGSAMGEEVNGLDECQAMVWRASIALDPVPADPDDPDAAALDDIPDPLGPGAPPDDMWEGVEPPEDSYFVHTHQTPDAQAGAWAQWPEEEIVMPTYTPTEVPDFELESSDPSGRGDLVDAVFRRLQQAALGRDLNRIPLAPSPADENRAYEREVDLATSPVRVARMLEVNAMAQDFFERHLPGSWGQQHLQDRFGVDLTGHEHFRPGQAPAGWTGLVQDLRRRGVTDEELLATGLATTASTGRLIDRFRDRVMCPITRPSVDGGAGPGGEGQILGFVGRRHPDLADVDHATGERNTKAGPKYLNTADTTLFHKGAQLYSGFHGAGGVGELLEAGAVPVVVEGPMDAIAITLATAGAHVGVAPLGTSLTEDQATQLAFLHQRTGAVPIVATDPDLAGQVAAERAFWMLTPHGLDPGYARLPAHSDPADLIARRGPAAVAAALAAAGPLADQLLDERLDHLPGRVSPQATRTELARLVAARSPEHWMDDVARIAARLDLPEHQVQRDLLDAVEAWEDDPRKPAQRALGGIHQVRERLAAAQAQPPAERWAPLGASLDPRLPHEPDWGAAAMMIQDAHDQGHDVTAAARQLVEEQPLGDRPAQDLRYRLVGRLDIEIPDFDDVNPHLDAHLGATDQSPTTPVAPSAPAGGPDDVPAGGRPGSGAAHERHRTAGSTRGDDPGPRPGSQRR